MHDISTPSHAFCLDQLSTSIPPFSESCRCPAAAPRARCGSVRRWSSACASRAPARRERQAASVWFALWKQGGVAALKISDRIGRFPKLSDEELAAIEIALLQGARANGFSTDLWTLQRVADVIAQRTGVVYHPGHVWRLLRYMGWSRQRPARRASERDDAAVEHWVKHTWPALKRGPVEPNAGLSSKTKAASR